MPKGKRNGPSKAQESRSCPYKAHGRGPEGDSVGEPDVREDWEDALCPICLEAPHNAVLLVCSSYADGCRPYMCNTSHRHSNCLDQFQKTQVGCQKSPSPLRAVSISERHSQQQMVVNTFRAGNSLNVRSVVAYPVPPPTMHRPVQASITFPEHVPDGHMRSAIEALNSRIASLESTVEALHSRIASLESTDVTWISRGRALHSSQLHFARQEEAEVSSMQFLDSEAEDSLSISAQTGSPSFSSSSKSKPFICPLCRGQIYTWRVIIAARKYFNGKARNCPHEACTFAGTYQELRVHARGEHSCAAPCEVDLVRQRDWLRMEQQREIGDVLEYNGGLE